MNILSLIGTHNRYNSMAATAAASAIDIQDDVIRKSLTDFENIEHRLESVAKIHGTEFINDSKATNIKCYMVRTRKHGEICNLDSGWH